MKTIVTTFFLSALTGTAAYVVVPLVPVAHDGLVAQLHNEWKAKYDVSYDNEEVEVQRRAVFADNLQYVSAHNERFNRGEIGFDMKLNVHADRTYSEWEDMLLSYTRRNVTIIDQEHHLGLHSTHLRQDLPTHVDWREQGAVTEVKNQGQCGSCWSFSTTGSIEGANFLKTGSLISLSEEMLINCVNGGEFDCQTGGDMVEAFKFVIKNGGIVAEETEPYESQDHEKCKYKGGNTKYPVSITGYKTIPTNDEDALKSAVAGRPVAVAIDASHRSFQFYHSGVYDEEECCTDCQLSDLDHGVLAVGYGTEKGKDYWLIKNSWSADWGDAGYIKILRNDKDRCGVATEASYPVA